MLSKRCNYLFQQVILEKNFYLSGCHSFSFAFNNGSNLTPGHKGHQGVLARFSSRLWWLCGDNFDSFCKSRSSPIAGGKQSPRVTEPAACRDPIRHNWKKAAAQNFICYSKGLLRPEEQEPGSHYFPARLWQERHLLPGKRKNRFINFRLFSPGFLRLLRDFVMICWILSVNQGQGRTPSRTPPFSQTEIGGEEYVDIR